VIRPDAVRLRANLRQGNGKNLCRIVVPPNVIETNAAQEIVSSGSSRRLARFETVTERGDSPHAFCAHVTSQDFPKHAGSELQDLPDTADLPVR
jgi:hypothetical protein